MEFRRYQPGDFEALYAIEESCFEPPLRFPRHYMRQLVDSPHAATWVAEEDDKLAGFAIVEWIEGALGAVAYIQTIEVAPGHRRQGAGRQLLSLAESSACAAGALAIWLHVDEKNSSAIPLYETGGYNCRGRKEHYYARHRPALIYSKEILPAPKERAME